MAAKKKVLIFTPGGVGGAERMSVNIAKMLADAEYDVKIVVIGRMTDVLNIIPDNLPVIRIPFHNKYCFSLTRMWWVIMRERADIVFSSVAAFNPRVIVAAKLARKKIVIRSSNMVGTYVPLKLFKTKITYPLVDRLIAQQEDMRQEMINILYVKPENIITLHNPLDSTEIENLASSANPFPKTGAVNYVNVARINYNKGQDILIKAFAKVKRKISSAHLWLIGSFKEKDGFYQELISLIESLSIEDSVHIVGYDRNPFKWTKNSDCFVLPSRFEGLPNALVEASYLKKPCVATDCLNFNREIIKDGCNGYIVHVSDVDGMASAMINALDLKECSMIYKPAKACEFVDVFRL